MDLDRQLAEALRRKAAAPGLADRVRRRIEQEEQRRADARFSRGVMQRVAAVLILLTALGAWGGWHRVEQVRGERARRDVLLAMHIASEKVRAAQSEVRRIGSDQ
jgi:hypothetical protein